jgi:hypothetical protein
LTSLDTEFRGLPPLKFEPREGLSGITSHLLGKKEIDEEKNAISRPSANDVEGEKTQI